MSDVGRVIWKSSYSLFFGLIIFFSLPATTLAFNVSISAPTQCSPFNITWDDSVSLFNLYILPFNDIPVVADDQSLIHDNITKTYNYTVNELPLKNGTQFIVVLDYGSVGDTGGAFVSLVQTVNDSTDSSCLATGPSPLPLSSFFALNPPVPSQCSTQKVSWNATRYEEAPEIRIFIPGGQAFEPSRVAPPVLPFTNWIVNIREGTQVVMLVRPANGAQAGVGSRTSPLMTVTANIGGHADDCLSADEFRSTTTLSSTTTTTPAATVTALTTVLPDFPKTAKKVSTPAIIGGVLGGLSSIAIICAAIVLCRSSKRNPQLTPFESWSVPAVFPRSFTRAASTRKRPLNVQEHPPPTGEPSRNFPFSSKRPLLLPSTDIEQGASSTYLPTNAATLAPAQRNAARPPPSPVTSPSISMDQTGADDEDDDGDQLIGDGARTDGRDGGRSNVIGTQYVRHTDAGEVEFRAIERPPSYNVSRG